MKTRIFKRRSEDYKVLEKKGYSEKPLTKESGLFQKIEPNKPGGPKQFGGTSGPPGFHTKKSKQPGKIKSYFLTKHSPLAYFGLEILNNIGFNTPKARFVASNLAVKEVEGYIPIAAFIHNKDEYGNEIIPPDIKDDKYLLKIHSKYELDFKNQCIIDRDTGKKYKISGNLFSADIGARLTADGDFQPERLNVGLVKRGDRFYTHLIDKEQVMFNGESYEGASVDPAVKTSELFSNTKRDQQLFIINKTEKSLDNNEFDRIFVNSRTLPSFNNNENVKKISKKYISNFRETANSAIAYFEKKYPGELKKFEDREKIRSKLADEVIARLALDINDDEKNALKEIIMEDLRGPYYDNCCEISENELTDDVLINTIVQDQAAELKALGIASMSVLLNELKEFLGAEYDRLQGKDPNVKDKTIK